MTKHWLWYLSPCFLAAGFSLIQIIISALDLDVSEGDSLSGILIYAPLFLYAAFADILIKGLFKLNIVQLWLLELGLIAVGYLVFWIFVMNGLEPNLPSRQ